jgi:DnaJ-class molecular chaperone
LKKKETKKEISQMDFNKDYYSILGVSKESDANQIKKIFYKLSFTHHPDKGGDAVIFNQISEAYNILTSEERGTYDKRSKWGANYDESLELLDYEFNNSAKGWNESKFEEWKKDNQLNIIVYVDDNFRGDVEYERWVACKSCGGEGRDTKSKIQIRDEFGNLLKVFDGEDGCDFCEGSGKSWNGQDCYFCGGKGMVGLVECGTCKGEKRVLGKQKLTRIKFSTDESSHKVEAMGHASKWERGRFGHLWIVKK